jgi:hypothetical protein
MRVLIGLFLLAMTLYALYHAFGVGGVLVWLALNAVLLMDRYEAHLRAKKDDQRLNGDWWRAG